MQLIACAQTAILNIITIFRLDRYLLAFFCFGYCFFRSRSDKIDYRVGARVKKITKSTKYTH